MTTIFLVFKQISIVVISNQNSFRVLFDKTASVYFTRTIYLGGAYILELEMASPGNWQHCANCIGTLSFPATVHATNN